MLGGYLGRSVGSSIFACICCNFPFLPFTIGQHGMGISVSASISIPHPNRRDLWEGAQLRRIRWKGLGVDGVLYSSTRLLRACLVLWSARRWKGREQRARGKRGAVHHHHTYLFRVPGPVGISASSHWPSLGSLTKLRYLR